MKLIFIVLKESALLIRVLTSIMHIFKLILHLIPKWTNISELCTASWTCLGLSEVFSSYLKHSVIYWSATSSKERTTRQLSLSFITLRDEKVQSRITLKWWKQLALKKIKLLQNFMEASLMLYPTLITTFKKSLSLTL